MEHPIIKSSPTQMQLGSGGLLDLLDPDPELIDVEVDVARPLGRIGRFTCQADRVNQESVAEHSAVGAVIALAETGRADLALAFLFHDCHETVLGDIATPIVATFARLLGPDIHIAIASVKARLDRAIATAAGIPTVWAKDVRGYVKDLDRRMYEAEYFGLWCDLEDRPDKVKLALSETNQLRTHLARWFSAERAVDRVTEGHGPFNRRLVVRLDLARPWNAENASTLWTCLYQELRGMVS